MKRSFRHTQDCRYPRSPLPAKAKFEVFDLATEDCTPLFDVTAVASKYMESRSLEEQIEAARMFVRNLIHLGYVELFYDCLLNDDRGSRHGKQITGDQVETELRNHENWVPHDRRAPDQRWVAIASVLEREESAWKEGFPTC